MCPAPTSNSQSSWTFLHSQSGIPERVRPKRQEKPLRVKSRTSPSSHSSYSMRLGTQNPSRLKEGYYKLHLYSSGEGNKNKNKPLNRYSVRELFEF